MYHDDGKSNKTNKIIWVKVPFINKCWNIQNQSCTKHISEWELKTHFIVRIKKKTHFIARKKNTFHSKNKKAKKLKCNILQQEYILKVECRIVEKQWPKQVSVTPFTKSNMWGPGVTVPFTIHLPGPFHKATSFDLNNLSKMYWAFFLLLHSWIL